MGANVSCPSGFEVGPFATCHAQCPPEFRNIQSGAESTGIPGQRCVHFRRNARSFPLDILPSGPEQPAHTQELERVRKETEIVKKLIEEDDAQAALLAQSRIQRSSVVQEYSRIQGDYANVSSTAKVAKQFQDTMKSLAPMRPPTAPASDLEGERKAILSFAQKDMFFIQIALFLAVLSMLGYLILPTDYAHSIALLLLTVAISFGFFLRR
jgi:hypothetical protein